MATIIRLKNAVFTNQNLPQLANFVKDGLVGAWRPKGDSASLIDVSGNGRQASLVGSPTFTETSMIGNQDAGILTDIAPTKNLTLIAVCRQPTSHSANQPGSMFAVSNWGNGNSSSLYRGGFTSGAPTELYFNGQTHAGSNKIVQSRVLEADHPGRLQEFVWMALTVTDSALRVFVPSMGMDGTTSADFANRTLPTEPLQIVSMNNNWEGTYPGETTDTELTEVLVYDKALSTVQLQEAYEISKAYHTSIGIAGI